MRFKLWMEETTKLLGQSNGAFKSDQWNHGWQPDNALVINCLRFLQGPGKGSEAIYAFSEPMREAITVAAFEMAATGVPKTNMIDSGGNLTPLMKQRIQNVLGNMRGIDFLIERYRLPIVHAWEKLTGNSYFSKVA